jgi:CheY-like chemotaxis protein
VTATNAQPQPSANSRKRVLIVEDDDDARDVLGELISALGHDVVPAATALEALARAEDSNIDFALIDLSLGGVDGCEVARQIRSTAQGQSVRLVALTGYSDRNKRKQADEAGFDDFIVKPAHMNVIEALLSARAERASAG